MTQKALPIWTRLVGSISKQSRSKKSPVEKHEEPKSGFKWGDYSEPIILSQSDLQTLPSESFPDATKGDCSWQTLLSAPSTKSNTFTVGIGVCKPNGGRLALHRHKQAEIYHVLSGMGVVTIAHKDYHVAAGDVVFIPGDTEHGVVNSYPDTELKWLYCFAADGFGEVVYRFSGALELEKGKL